MSTGGGGDFLRFSFPFKVDSCTYFLGIAIPQLLPCSSPLSYPCRFDQEWLYSAGNNDIFIAIICNFTDFMKWQFQMGF